MKEKILKYLCDLQVVGSSYLTRAEYKGFYLNDDECPVARYSYISKETGFIPKELKSVMLEMRNDGLVELVLAVNHDGVPSGSGWSLTEKGLAYCVDNKIVIAEE